MHEVAPSRSLSSVSVSVRVRGFPRAVPVTVDMKMARRDQAWGSRGTGHGTRYLITSPTAMEIAAAGRFRPSTRAGTRTRRFALHLILDVDRSFATVVRVCIRVHIQSPRLMSTGNA